MITALAASLIAALLLAAVARAMRPSGLLDFLAPAWQWWLIMRPVWLPEKASGGCAMCTATWIPGVPVAAAVALLTPAGWWALCVPILIGVVFEIALEK
jgi:hypothetical protein